MIALSTSSVGKNELLCKLRLLFFNSSSIIPASVRVNKPVSSYRGGLFSHGISCTRDKNRSFHGNVKLDIGF